MSRALPSLPAADAWSASWVEPLEVAWTLEVDRGTVDVTVPDGTIAELPLLDGADDVLTPGAHQRTWSTPPP